ncbi:phosphatase PAP2 family protein [Streptomyces clavuligerus]|uniref:Integral membrane protein n=1 Tax=Streptomyces clavuligerus TaxID=1901 RepID=E2Q7P2_STRCL|nr:phosphatase PAP2 family protein [Streptomyces clavuligerus]ANW19711.1 hypothetical protein BB341_16530 [Streptomyces clavuligerus]AXU14324.1 phosphatase PAP2 family protein [Streptomyces clavuligerus]EFG07448.1 Integral membrane protein [Streptomyces clavuligerus]MBY6304328.1 phosphatase PAP2 family protein [Streptomyces clavuligerus]QCS07098.1 phosphatase PAP2 family protein [Streptomyces clavuligerus]
MDSSITRGLYRDITELAESSPAWVHTLAEVGTEAVVVLFAALFVAVWWRARRRSSADLAIALLGALGTAVGYVVSESLKTVFDEERPCRTVTEAAASIATCPPTGDWSFPSNHSAIAGGAAVALALAWPRLVWLTAPLALLAAFSRVFVGVHYPHDVIVGLAVGGVVAGVFTIVLTRWASALVTTVRTSRGGPLAWFAGPGTR